MYLFQVMLRCFLCHLYVPLWLFFMCNLFIPQNDHFEMNKCSMLMSIFFNSMDSPSIFCRLVYHSFVSIFHTSLVYAALLWRFLHINRNLRSSLARHSSLNDDTATSLCNFMCRLDRSYTCCLWWVLSKGSRCRGLSRTFQMRLEYWCFLLNFLHTDTMLVFKCLIRIL